MSTILNGKEISDEILQQIREEVTYFKNKTGKSVTLAVIIASDDAASAVYVKNKRLACETAGVISKIITLKSTSSEEDVIAVVKKLNKNKDVNGILVQLPLPKHINEKNILSSIATDKDADCFLAKNIGSLILGESGYSPCTPQGIMKLIEKTGTNLTGKHAVVVGRSNIVGKPVAMMLLSKNATVTMCHSKTVNLKEITRIADVLVVAIGRAKMITADMVKPGAVVIDVGINRTDNGKLCGDVDFEEVEKIASFITPVPKGVGPMTVCCLLKNTLSLARKQNNLE